MPPESCLAGSTDCPDDIRDPYLPGNHARTIESMRLVDRAGLALELEIVGYEFPTAPSREATRELAPKVGVAVGAVRHTRYDDNWLFVRGHVETPKGSWDFRDPCLITWEAAELCRWLRAASAGVARDSLGFVEPNITFERAEPTEDQSILVVVSFALEARPPWADEGDFAIPVEFRFVKSDLVSAAADLEANLARFPER